MVRAKLLKKLAEVNAIYIVKPGAQKATRYTVIRQPMGTGLASRERGYRGRRWKPEYASVGSNDKKAPSTKQKI